MNVLLAAGGYPWTVIPVEERNAYMAALEAASVSNDIGPFTDFLATLVRANLEGKPGKAGSWQGTKATCLARATAWRPARVVA